MKNSTPQSNQKSRAKRDPGWVKLQRGFRKHIPLMSSNACKLFTWLLVVAEWKGERRGTYESNYADIAQEIRWNLKMLSRSLDELRQMGYVTIIGAANQYENTLITIPKYDQHIAEFGEDTGVLSKNAEDTAEDRATDTSVLSGVLSKPANSQTAQDLRALKNLEEVKNERKVSHDGHRDGLTLTGKTWKQLGLFSLPVRFQGFVDLVEKNPLDEDLVMWGKCTLDLCAERGIEYPKVFLKLVKDAERAIYEGSDEVPRVAGLRGVREELMR